MEKIKNLFVLILLGILLPLILLNCTKYNEKAPFFDGLYFEYDIKGKRITYNLYALDNEKYKIIRTEKSKVFGNKIRELFVDVYGKVYKSTYKRYKGKFSPIWIPVHEMEIGNSFDGSNIVARKDKWREWEVLVTKDTVIEEEQYFEFNTGFLVGVKGRLGMSYEVVLVNTNADIPTVEE